LYYLIIKIETPETSVSGVFNLREIFLRDRISCAFFWLTIAREPDKY